MSPPGEQPTARVALDVEVPTEFTTEADLGWARMDVTVHVIEGRPYVAGFQMKVGVADPRTITRKLDDAASVGLAGLAEQALLGLVVLRSDWVNQPAITRESGSGEARRYIEESFVRRKAERKRYQRVTATELAQVAEWYSEGGRERVYEGMFPDGSELQRESNMRTVHRRIAKARAEGFITDES